ncbi:MAG: phosphorelay protein [Rhodospirillales bacterium]|nr:phosphorelay protein [Rhodospirillales bacterium]
MVEDKLEVINPTNTLKKKVGTNGLGAIDLEALEKAEEVIASLADSYLVSVADDFRKIDEAFEKLEAATGGRKKELMGVFQESFNLKGQGGSFGYNLMTAIGNELCLFIEKLDKAGPKEVEAIKLHIDSIKLVIGNDIKGDGGDTGKQMLAGLQQVCDKLLA